MGISADEVRRVADLARMGLDDAELDEMARQLGRILGYMEKLRELDTEGVEPTAHVLPLRNVWREDVPGETLSPDEALANAPERQDNCFKVPKIVEAEGE